MRLLKIKVEGDDLSANEIPTSKERKYFILARLLDGEHVSYQQLADTYFVSRSSIANDITFVKELLSKDNVPLDFDNEGTYIRGDEQSKQKILKRIVTNFMRETNSNNRIIEKFIDTNTFRKIKKAFERKTKEWSLEIPENYLDDIVISTSIVVSRGARGFHLQQNDRNQLGNIFFQFEKYPLVYELLTTVEKEGIYQFSADELRYLSYIVLGNGFKIFMKNASIPKNFQNEVKKLIANVGADIGIDFTQETKLESDLLLHLYQMVLRLKAGMTVINPLLNEIKHNYARLYGVVWYALREFGSTNKLTISDDEVAFVTIHFQAAIERLKNIKRILFVCPNGIGTSSLISAKMHRILPSVTMIEVVSTAELAQQNLDDVDLIISTVSLPKMSVPVAKISPMLTLEDMKTIVNQYFEITMSNSITSTETAEIGYALENIKGHVHFKNVSSKTIAIDYLLKTNNWPSKEARNKYCQSVHNRERLQSTYLGNGFAIPHGDPKLVAHSAISVLILDKPIDWGNNKVDVISLLMIRNEDKQILKPFMNLVMKGIKNKKWFINKMMEAK